MAIGGLKFFRRNLFVCLQEVTSSLHLFKVASSIVWYLRKANLKFKCCKYTAVNYFCHFLCVLLPSRKNYSKYGTFIQDILTDHFYSTLKYFTSSSYSILWHMALSRVSEQCITCLEHSYTEKILISSQVTDLDIESEIKQHLQLVWISRHFLSSSVYPQVIVISRLKYSSRPVFPWICFLLQVTSVMPGIRDP